MTKKLEKIDVFEDFDLEGIWEGFKKPKNSIFAFWGKFLGKSYWELNLVNVRL